MVLYVCKICNYTTDHKGKYERHLNKKKQCKPGDINKIGKSENPPLSQNSLPKPSQILPNPPKSSQNPPKNEKKDKDDICCQYCFKSFTRQDNLKRHIEYKCKKRQMAMDELEYKNSELLDKNIQLELTTKSLQKKIEEIYETILNKLTIQQTTINKNKINATIDNNKYIDNLNNIESQLNIENQQNIGEQNIENQQNIAILNSYGNESIDHLSDQYFRNLIPFPYTAVPKLIHDIHCNPKVPENHNLKKTNKNDKFIQYYDGQEWKVENKKKILDNLVEMTFTILENTVDREDQLEKKHLDRFSDFRDKFYENKDSVKTNHMEEAEVMIINNSK